MDIDSTAAAHGDIVTPGQNIGLASDYKIGKGVFRTDNVLYASTVGRLEVVNENNESRPQIRVVTGTARPMQTTLLPEIGATVIARVTKVSQRSAHTELLAQQDHPFISLFKGTIRQQDVRRTEIDKVDIYRCFAPGDLVRARILSLGDRHSYFLTTADNSFGVVEALSTAGAPMVPVSWQEMQCTQTGTREFRKVAKVDSNKPMYSCLS